ncbi:Trypsin domain containing protein, partial [Asbolus verrucosus]
MDTLSLLLCILAINSTAFSKTLSQINGRIIGGKVAHPLQFPYAAAIYVQTADSRYFCGGTLLSNQWILTAGQCVDGATLFQIYLGSISLVGDDPNRLVLATSTHVLHPEYNASTLENDIGLIELRMP